MLFFPHSPDILNWLDQFCSSLSKIFTFGQSPNLADFILNHLYFRDHRKHRGLEWKMLRWFNSRKSCLFYYNAFAYKYLFTSKVLTCLVSKEKLKKKCTSIKGRNSRKCKIFQNYFSSAFQKKILAYFKSSIARMIHRIEMLLYQAQPFKQKRDQECESTNRSEICRRNHQNFAFDLQCRHLDLRDEILI